jgi:hypothetical protein
MEKKAGTVICTAIIAGKSDDEIQERLRISHPDGRAAKSRKSCREQVAWYRSKLRTGHIVLSPDGRFVRRGEQVSQNALAVLVEAPAVRTVLENCGKQADSLQADSTSLKSTFYQQLVEHAFIAEVLQETWFGYGRVVEVLRAEVDSFGYDLVFECEGILRYVQLKTSKLDGRRQSVNVNTALAKKPGGCVIWLLREEDPSTRRIRLSYLLFGGPAGERLPALDGFKVGKHSKGDSTGKKNDRPSIRLVPKSRFTRMKNIRNLVETLFGLSGPAIGC